MSNQIWYKYKYRGFSPGCQPKGHVKWDENPAPYGSVAYDRELTEAEVQEYELELMDDVDNITTFDTYGYELLISKLKNELIMVVNTNEAYLDENRFMPYILVEYEREGLIQGLESISFKVDTSAYGLLSEDETEDMHDAYGIALDAIRYFKRVTEEYKNRLERV